MTEYLYRYQRLGKEDEPRYLRTQSLLVENKCYLSSHIWFNDPYDCKAFLTLKGSDNEDIWKYFDDILTKLQIELDGAARCSLINEIGLGDKASIDKFIDWFRSEGKREFCVESPVVKELMVGLRSLLDKEHAKTGFLCLTQKPNDILMWSHYADCHRGLCFQFNKTILAGLQEASLVPVQYSEGYPTLKELMSERFRLDWVRFFLTRKSALWRSETEWRLIGKATGGLAQIEREPLELPVGAISGVILGCQMTDDDRKKVRAWTMEGKQPIKVFEARLKPDSYGLDIQGLADSIAGKTR